MTGTITHDYDWFQDFFNKEVAPVQGLADKSALFKLEWDSSMLHKQICVLGRELNEEINEMMLFDPPKCKF